MTERQLFQRRSQWFVVCDQFSEVNVGLRASDGSFVNESFTLNESRL